MHVVPRFFDCGVAPEGPETDDVHGGSRCTGCGGRRCGRRPGRSSGILDVTVAGTVLLVTSPLLAVIAVAVKLSSPGPVLFHQKRSARTAKRSTSPSSARCASTTTATRGGRWTTDPRVTAVGRVLRATSLDELPQLWGVVQGRMSLVGPRPERPSSSSGSGPASTATTTGTDSRPASPGGRRCTGSAATPRSRSGPATTTSTSSTGRCGETSSSWSAPSPRCPQPALRHPLTARDGRVGGSPQVGAGADGHRAKSARSSNSGTSGPTVGPSRHPCRCARAPDGSRTPRRLDVALVVADEPGHARVEDRTRVGRRSSSAGPACGSRSRRAAVWGHTNEAREPRRRGVGRARRRSRSRPAGDSSPPPDARLVRHDHERVAAPAEQRRPSARPAPPRARRTDVTDSARSTLRTPSRSKSTTP